ncbi:MAG TPA: hypothetical protein VK541_18875 [Pedobacter sp.]|uniref:hypothetical protein n=1 Tax=Pedobacter sp. TaxID=1411316 RepID=UPI002CFAB6D3|nr:hypothetical protein [Pedobacter sp.]HMI04562.1 hypothetical protein [Pedobacter sp.]
MKRLFIVLLFFSLHSTILYGQDTPVKIILNSANLLPGILQAGISTIVIAGHSNTVDQIFNSVMKKQPIKALEETEYNKVFIITYDKKDPARSTYVKLDLN